MGKVLAMLGGGGHKTFWGSFNMGVCSFSHAEGGRGTQNLSDPPRNKGDSRPCHLQGNGAYTGLVRQAWGVSLFGPM